MLTSMLLALLPSGRIVAFDGAEYENSSWPILPLWCYLLDFWTKFWIVGCNLIGTRPHDLRLKIFKFSLSTLFLFKVERCSVCFKICPYCFKGRASFHNVILIFVHTAPIVPSQVPSCSSSSYAVLMRSISIRRTKMETKHTGFIAKLHETYLCID